MITAAALLAAACIDLSIDPDEIVAIELAEFPWPSVVAGDTLRDGSGVVSPLVARLFDGDGNVVDGPVEFIAARPGVQIINGNRLIADDTTTGTVGILASVPGIQSVIREIAVVPAPISLAAGSVITPLRWVVPDDPNTNTSQPVSARVLASADSGVGSWIVTFQLEAGGRQIAESDTTQIFLIGDNGRASYVDTTDASGSASRRVRLKIVPGLVPPDSAVITMRASYKGQALPGSPVRRVLPLSPG